MNFPVDLWRDLCVAAAEELIPVSLVLENAAREYLKRRHGLRNRKKTRRP